MADKEITIEDIIKGLSEGPLAEQEERLSGIEDMLKKQLEDELGEFGFDSFNINPFAHEEIADAQGGIGRFVQGGRGPDVNFGPSVLRPDERAARISSVGDALTSMLASISSIRNKKGAA